AVAAAISMLLIDQPLARWIAGYEPLGFWDSGIAALEWGILLPVFKWALAILFVAGMIACVAVPSLRRFAPAWMFLAASHLLSRIAMVELKDATSRLRPHEWLKHGGETFFREHSGLAFPSGHVVSFASVVIPLVVVFPRLRPLLIVVAYVVAARIVADAHWLSDTLAGVSLVCLVTWCCAWVIRPRRG
ncbi:MAG TPA: phosphatase PAP2 family protein, partial [Kofleriaceae bacterium]|nr:phosphatase PAP2 family protein [Kofleriaceae bacterium]